MTSHFHYFMIQLSLTFLTATSNSFLDVNPFSKYKSQTREQINFSYNCIGKQVIKQMSEKSPPLVSPINFLYHSVGEWTVFPVTGETQSQVLNLDLSSRCASDISVTFVSDRFSPGYFSWLSGLDVIYFRGARAVYLDLEFRRFSTVVSRPCWS